MEFLMALFIFPLVSFLFGIIGQMLIKKIYIVVGITFLGWLIATFTIFNESFLIWVFIYSLLSLIGSAIVYFLQKSK
ncbi:MAG: hypothetical protein APF76_18385 [Desulfitibacter sp. BRH_c19]|nr:MAG: hypothetical protein APF76_18385 [Desulfitibacter sp. BRH_c19]